MTPVVHLKDEDLHKEEKTTEEHHEAGVHKATLHTMKEGEVDDHRAPSHYELLHKDAHTESHVEKPVVHHETPKHVDRKYHTEHETHAELDHAYDDQKDIEPVHFHEGAVLKAFDHPDSHDYAHTDFEALAKKRAYDRHYTEEKHTLPYRSEYHTLLRPQHHRERETYRYEHETPHYWTGDETPRYAEYSRTDIHDGEKHGRGHHYAIEDLDEEVTPFEHHHLEGRHYEHGGVVYEHGDILGDKYGHGRRFETGFERDGHRDYGYERREALLHELDYER